MGNYSSGKFIPKNPRKYIGKMPIVFRSSWELSMQKLLDTHPNVIKWSSESITMPYLNPLTKRWTLYVPDFLVIYIDKNGQTHGEIIEIKPMKESLTEHAKSKRDKATQAINYAKWSAAVGYCKKRGLTFRVMTEHDLFKFKRRG
jgi:hypothetical protein